MGMKEREVGIEQNLNFLRLCYSFSFPRHYNSNRLELSLGQAISGSLELFIDNVMMTHFVLETWYRWGSRSTDGVKSNKVYPKVMVCFLVISIE